MSFPSISEEKAASRSEFAAGACAGPNSLRSTRHRGLRGRGPAANTLVGEAEIPLGSAYGLNGSLKF